MSLKCWRPGNARLLDPLSLSVEVKLFSLMQRALMGTEVTSRLRLLCQDYYEHSHTYLSGLLCLCFFECATGLKIKDLIYLF